MLYSSQGEGVFIKCTSCGGFFPWQGWDKFFISNTDPGNGGTLAVENKEHGISICSLGILRQPKGQTSIFYEVPPSRSESNIPVDTVDEEELF